MLTGPERLRELARFLDEEVRLALNGVKFDMRDWGKYRTRRRPNGVPPSTIKTAKKCGFAGCAIGWASMCPVLRKEGINKDLVRADRPHYWMERSSLWADWSDVEDFFDIDERTAAVLFDFLQYDLDVSDANPKAIDYVINRIRDAAEGFDGEAILEREHERLRQCEVVGPYEGVVEVGHEV